MNATHDNNLSKVNILNRQLQCVFTKENCTNIPELDGPSLLFISDIEIYCNGVKKLHSSIVINMLVKE